MATMVNRTTNGKPALRPGERAGSLFTVLKPHLSRVQGDKLLLQGVSICPAAEAKLAGLLPGATAIIVASGMQHHELQRVFAGSDLLDLALFREGGTVFIKRLPRPEELPGVIGREFVASRSAGLKMLARLKPHLEQDVLVSVISEHLGVIAAKFSFEEINSAEYRSLLEILGELGSHSLNRVFLTQFAKQNANSPAWIETLLLTFREKFPHERYYHEAAGDHDFEHEDFASAGESYAAAQRLSPNNAALKGKIKNNDRAQKREAAQLAGKLKQTVAGLWEKCAAGDGAAAELLSAQALYRPGEVFELVRNELEPDLVAFDALEAAAERLEWPKLAERWHRLGEEASAEALSRLAADKALNPARANLIAHLLDDGSVERLSAELVRKLAMARHEPRHRWQQICTRAYTKLFADKHYQAAKEHERAGRVDQALAELKICLEADPRDEVARHDSAYIMTGTAKQMVTAGDRAGAAAKIEEALAIYPECLPALDIKMNFCLPEHRYNEAIALIETILGILRKYLEKDKQELWMNLLAANHNNLGSVYIMRYVHLRDRADLEIARKSGLAALVIKPDRADYLYNVMRARLLLGEIGPVMEWAGPYFAGENIESAWALDLLELTRDPGVDRAATEPLRQTIGAYLKREAAKPGCAAAISAAAREFD